MRTRDRDAVVPAPARRASTLRRDLRGAYTIWKRELIRFFRERARVVTAFVQPLLYLLIFGTGLAAAVRADAVAGDYRIFLLPGVIVMTALFTSMFAAVSIIWDREFGFLKEILVAPLGRSSVIAGKTLGGATTASMQGLAILLLAPLVDLSPSLTGVLTVIPVLVLFAVSINLLGIALASKITTMQGFMMIMNFITLPLFFTSGALFPLDLVPAWLKGLAIVNPVTYATDAIRRMLIPDFPPQVYWGPEPLSIAGDIAVLAGFALLMFVLAVRGLNRQP